jgi:hypothetical protein
MAERKFDGVDADFAAEITQVRTDSAIEAIRRKSLIDPGVPGDCDFCGEWSGRLIEGACAPCRDRYKLP